jgi:hypothetical protein
MRTITAGILASAMCVALLLPACSKNSDAAPDANQSSTTTQAAAPAVPPKPYIAPEALYEAVASEYAPCQQSVGEGIVDWSRGVIVASGSAKAMSELAVSGTARPAGATPQERIKAQRAAEQTAIRNAVLAGNGITVDSRGKFSDLRKGTVEVEAVATGREIISNTWDAPTQTATATVSLPMYGLSGVVRLDGVAMPATQPATMSPAPPLPPPGGQKGEEADLIVIDARGTVFHPCLMPRIVDEKEKVLFDPSELPPEALAGRHMAICVTALTATSIPTTSTQPTGTLSRRILVKATNPMVQDHYPSFSNLMLVPGEQEKLFRHGDAMELLKAGRLVIIVDIKAIKE